MCYIDEEKKLEIQQKQQTTEPNAQLTEEQRRGEELRLQRERIAQKRANLWNQTQRLAVQVPQMSISQKGDISVGTEKYARKSKETIGAGKRKRYQKFSASALYQRRVQAEAVEHAENAWEESRNRIKEQHPEIFEGRSSIETDAILQFWTDTDAQNQDLLGENMQKECIAQFMELDMNFDLRTDQAFAQQSPRMEEVFRKSEAFFRMYQSDPDMVDELPANQSGPLHQRMRELRAFSNYYQIRKKVMTNSYYRSHYNSEISYRYHESDTREQKNLTMLLWQMESIKNHGLLLDNQTLKTQSDQMLKYRENVEPSKEEVQDTRKAKEDFRVNSQYNIQQNAARMREEDQRLQNGEALVRTKIQELERQAHPGQEQIEPVKAEFVKRISYLKRKYGNGLPLLSPKELDAHQEEILRDFEGLSQYRTVFGKILQVDRKEDQDLEKLYTYYDRWLRTERTARQNFAAGGMSYSDYKRKAAVDTTYTQDLLISWTFLSSMVENVVAVSDTMDLEVKWDTCVEENNVKLEEVLRSFDRKGLMEKGRRIQRELSKNSFQWSMLFPESQNMTRTAAAKYFVEKESERDVEAQRQEWRKKALSVNAFSATGIGTDDFLELNRTYMEILEREDLQRQYGLTAPEVLNEYREILKSTEGFAERMQEVSLYFEKAANVQDELNRRGNQEEAQKLGSEQSEEDRRVQNSLRQQLDQDLERVKNAYADELSEIRKKEWAPVYHRFLDFQERAGMWSMPEHRGLAERVLNPAVQKESPGQTVQIAGRDCLVFDDPRMQELQGKELKEEASFTEFQQEMETYRQLYARHQVYSRVLREAESDEQPADSLWQRLREEGMTKNGYMRYDLDTRCMVYRERMEQSLDRLKSLLK